MMGRKFYLAQFLCVCLAVALGGPQVGGGEDALLRLREIRKNSQERVLRGVLTIYIWKMTDAVGLTEEQAAQVFPMVKRSFETRWQLAAKRRNLLELFKRAVDVAPPGESKMKELLEQWAENETKLQAAQGEMRRALTRILTPEQQARSVLFEQQFEGDLVRVIAEIRREQAQRPRPEKGEVRR